MALAPYWLQNALFSVCYIARRFWFCFVHCFKRGRYRSFCSCIACVISLSSLKLFSVSFVCFLFSFPFVLKRPFLGSYKN
ncbi:hypothetical protein HMPREF1408_00040 [Helicobacter pylori GAM245Ai]|nr:hypothetical protein HMPREF1408_00040 [Helicobacter pylori GAM245Ai]